MVIMKRLYPWAAAKVIVTIIFATILFTTHQSLRMNANDPQIQLAEDTAAQLDTGIAPNNTVSGMINMRKSLAPFVIIYDLKGHPVIGNGFIDDHLPTVPYGVLTSSDDKTYHTVTWQPDSDVRLASVTVKANDYYVLSGRSLMEVEKREQLVTLASGFGWIISLGVLFGMYVMSQQTSKGRS